MSSSIFSHSEQQRYLNFTKKQNEDWGILEIGNNENSPSRSEVLGNNLQEPEFYLQINSKKSDISNMMTKQSADSSSSQKK